MIRKTFTNLQGDDRAIAPTAAMEPKEMGQIWMKHYPNHRNDQASHQICESICSLLRNLANLEVDGNFTTRLARVLSATRIPMEQFEEYEAGAMRS